MKQLLFLCVAATVYTTIRSPTPYMIGLTAYVGLMLIDYWVDKLSKRLP